MATSRYTVKQVAALTGVPAATLRAWERRYGVVSPQRSDSRYRLYSTDDVTRLTRMAELVRRGSPASLAAEHVLATLDTAYPAVSVPAGSDELPAQAPPVSDLVTAAQTYDQAMLTRVLDSALAGISFEAAASTWLLPALEEVGSAWERGDLDIAGEHFVSAAVHHRLATAFDAAGVHTGAPVAVVGLPPGAQHALGTLTFAVCLRRQGIDVRFLGADLPADSWHHTVQTVQPDGVVVSVPTPGDASAAAALVGRVLSEASGVHLWVGGRGGAAALAGTAAAVPADADPDTRPTTVDGQVDGQVHVLPPSVVDAALDVARTLHDR